MAVISWGDEVKKPKGGTAAFTDGKLAYQPPAETETPRWINPLGWNPQSMADYRGVMSPINLDWPGPELNWKPQGMADFMGARTYFQPGAASRQAAQAGTMAQAMGAKSYIQLDRPQIVNNPSMTQSQPQAPAVEQPANPLEQHGRGQSGQSRTMANGDVYNYWAKYGQEMTRQGLIRQGVMDGTNYNSNNPLFDLRSSNMEAGRYGVGDLRYKVPTTNTATAGTGYGGYGRGYGGYGYGGGGGYSYSRPKPKWFMEMLSWRI